MAYLNSDPHLPTKSALFPLMDLTHLVYAFSRKIFLMLIISLPETWECTFKALSNISDGAFLDDDDDDDDDDDVLFSLMETLY